MVSIKSCCTIFPCEATPNGSMLLSESEQIKGYYHSPTIYIYRANHNHAPEIRSNNEIHIMKDSLAKILVHYYPLAGRLRMINGDKGARLELDCTPQGAEFLEAESTNSLDDYGDFEPNDTIKDLFPKVDYGEPVENLPLLLVQVTRFTCGGLCVGIALSNVLVDGIAGTLFVDSWAKLARGTPLEDTDMPIFMNRSQNTNILSSSSLGQLFEHLEFKPLPLVLGSSDFTAERKKETSLATLRLTKEMVEKLKKKANNDLMIQYDGTRIEQHRPYSRYECISAHIWKVACKARQSADDQPTVVHIVAGTRNRLKPPLPLNYFGNATYPTVTPTCLCGDIVSKPLSFGAQKIREAVEVLTDEYLKSGFEFIRSMDDVRRIRPRFNREGVVEAPFHGNPNVNIWSWMSNMPMYGPDFGCGRPAYMGPGVVGGDGRAFIMPSAAGDGSLSIVIRLQSAFVEPFKKFFYDGI